MTNITLIQTPEGKAADLFAAIKGQLGMVPNIFKAFAHSPAVLEAYLQQSGTLATGALSAQLREQIAVVTAGTNACDYCASAHTLLGKNAGVSTDELAKNLRGESADSKTQAALTFAKEIVEKQGRVTETTLTAVRNAGFSEAEIVEIIAHVGMNIFTNYFNHIAGTQVDFPLVSTTTTSKAA